MMFKIFVLQLNNIMEQEGNKMKNIYIVGGNGFARECYSYIQRMAEYDKDIHFAGFLGEGGYKADLKDFSSQWICDVADFQFKENDYAVIGSGNPEIRERIYKYLKSKGVKFFTVIDPSVIIFPHSEIGEANIFTISCVVSSEVKIGCGNLFNGHIGLGHDVEVGDFNFFGPNSHLLGGVKIGNMNSIGTSSVLLPHSAIGDNNKIAPLSAVYKGCKNNCYMIGNPARNMGDLKIFLTNHWGGGRESF